MSRHQRLGHLIYFVLTRMNRSARDDGNSLIDPKANKQLLAHANSQNCLQPKRRHHSLQNRLGPLEGTPAPLVTNSILGIAASSGSDSQSALRVDCGVSSPQIQRKSPMYLLCKIHEVWSKSLMYVELYPKYNLAIGDAVIRALIHEPLTMAPRSCSAYP